MPPPLIGVGGKVINARLPMNLRIFLSRYSEEYILKQNGIVIVAPEV